MFGRWRYTSIAWDEIHSSRPCLPAPAARRQAIRAEVRPRGASPGGLPRGLIAARPASAAWWPDKTLRYPIGTPSAASCYRPSLQRFAPAVLHPWPSGRQHRGRPEAPPSRGPLASRAVSHPGTV